MVEREIVQPERLARGGEHGAVAWQWGLSEGEQVPWRGACVDGAGNVVDMRREGGGARPGGDVWVQVCEDEGDPCARAR